MLFLLTGDIQIGKTRWLEKLVGDLSLAGVTCQGVIAPGIWLDHGTSTPRRFEKLGIDNVLLPSGTRVPFARRRDLALDDGFCDKASQSAQAGLGWAIDDAAIQIVDGHFARLIEQAGSSEKGGDAPAIAERVLIVDELGRLELLRDGGLTHATKLLELGPTAFAPHAIAIVRETLVEIAETRFAKWETRRISPDEASRRTVLETIVGTGE